MTPFCLGRPTTLGKTTRGVSSSAKPAFMRPEPLSMTMGRPDSYSSSSSDIPKIWQTHPEKAHTLCQSKIKGWWREMECVPAKTVSIRLMWVGLETTGHEDLALCCHQPPVIGPFSPDCRGGGRQETACRGGSAASVAIARATSRLSNALKSHPMVQCCQLEVRGSGIGCSSFQLVLSQLRGLISDARLRNLPFQRSPVHAPPQYSGPGRQDPHAKPTKSEIRAASGRPVVLGAAEGDAFTAG